MINYVPTKEEQIESLIKFNPGIVLRKCFTIEEMREMTSKHIDYYKLVFTVTRREILEYIKKNYTLDRLGLTPESREHGYQTSFYQRTKINRRDGLNVERENNKFKCYYFDVEHYFRTRELDQSTGGFFYLENEDAVYEKFVNGIISASGTGLTFAEPGEEADEQYIMIISYQGLTREARTSLKQTKQIIKKIYENSNVYKEICNKLESDFIKQVLEDVGIKDMELQKSILRTYEYLKNQKQKLAEKYRELDNLTILAISLIVAGNGAYRMVDQIGDRELDIIETLVKNGIIWMKSFKG